MKKLHWTLLSLFILFFACGTNEKLEELESENQEMLQKLEMEKSEILKKMEKLNADLAFYEKADIKLNFLSAKMKNLKARIVTNHGDIEVSFLPYKAPIHCFAFIERSLNGFYDNTTFHRVMADFMIQGGDPNSKDKDPNNDGMGAPLLAIPHEFNTTKHVPGVLSMARVSDTRMGAGSQFFIMHGTKSHLDGQYTAFGKVLKGMEVVDAIAQVETNERNRPLKPVVIKTIEIIQ
ncbi:MAG: hypothetical protein DWQ05_05225 [Calditrichaeota bacterium]|nr:MAG: hypothetical protein DWQ05_05225 [Calditrichota bacterium]